MELLEIAEASLGRQPLVRGKTKDIFESIEDPREVFIHSKDDLTAGDGAKHDIVLGKARLANQTTCNVFRFLKSRGIPVAFEEQLDPQFGNVFLAPKCIMLPYEVVVRGAGYGSYIDRNPHIAIGHIFPDLVLEYFLKTKGKKWKSKCGEKVYDLVKDDPLMDFSFAHHTIDLYYPGHTSEERKTAPKDMLVGQKPFLTLGFAEVFTYDDEQECDILDQMGVIARHVFTLLAEAWKAHGRELVDFKVEFGIAPSGKLLLADVIDSDSWRVIDTDGSHLSKQAYRDGEDTSKVMNKYELAAEITGKFI